MLVFTLHSLAQYSRGDTPIKTTAANRTVPVHYIKLNKFVGFFLRSAFTTEDSANERAIMTRYWPVLSEKLRSKTQNTSSYFSKDERAPKK